MRTITIRIPDHTPLAGALRITATVLRCGRNHIRLGEQAQLLARSASDGCAEYRYGADYSRPSEKQP